MSQIFRFFESGSFKKDSNLNIEGESHHIIARVLRMKDGDRIELLNGEGDIAQATLLSVDKKSASARIENVKSISPPKLSIRLLIGCLKGEKLSLVTQKVTELGVQEIGFFNSEHSVAMKSESFLEKTNKTLIEAMRQSGNPFLPKTSFHKKVENIPFDGSSEHWNIILDETETVEFPNLAKQVHPKSVSLFVGPEGGFSAKEREFFRSQKCQFVRIAPYVLRADTAAIAAVGLFRATFA